MDSGPSGQNVLTWFPDGNYTHIAHDFSPLVRHLIENKLVPPKAYVGTVALGAESFFSAEPITFTAKSLSLVIGNNSTVNPALVGSCRSLAGKLGPQGLVSLVGIGLSVLLLGLF